MKTRWILNVLILFVITVVASFSPRELLLAAEHPNVLFFLIDDLRPELGCYGNTHVKTPNIDALAKAGVRFERAYCQFPLCNPSRSSMLTGRHPPVTGVLDNSTWFGATHPDFVSLPRHFKDKGYSVLRTGKVFHGGIDDVDAWTEGGEKRTFEGAISDRKPPVNQKQNSDRIVTLEGDGESHQDYKTATRAIDYLRRHGKGDKPFFIACGFTKPHSPPTAPKKFLDMYDPKSVPLPPDFQPRPTVPEGFPKPSVPVRNGDLFVDRDASPEEAREVIRAYWASLTWTDWNLGRVIAELDTLKLRENTIIVFWGDHGYHLGEKGKWSKHGSLWEIGTRVPLIVIDPQAKGNGSSSPRPVQSLDLFPTLCELCGLPTPGGLAGHSLKPLLANPQAEWSHPAFSVFGNAKGVSGVAVRTQQYRYVEYDGGKAGAMLFDEQADPNEMKNLVDDPKLAAVKSELSKLAKLHSQSR